MTAVRRAGLVVAAAAVITALACLAFIVAPAAAGGATIRAGWIMNANQWQNLQATGYTGPPPQFQVCTDGGGAQAIACQPGMTATFENYYTLRTWLRANTGHEQPYVLFDLEGWQYTPAYQASAEGYYDRLAAQAAAAAGVRLIAAPVTGSGDETTVEADAARDGAWAVELQIQYATSQPAKYQALTAAAVAAIRAESNSVVIIDGIATDAGGYPTTATLMRASYDRTHALVGGYWLNMAPWTVHANGTPATGCAPDGCTSVGAHFLTMIGEPS